MVNLPLCDFEKDEFAKKHPDVFSVSVLTRSQAKKLALEDVNLCDSMLAPVFSGDGVPSLGQPGDVTKVEARINESVCHSAFTRINK